MSTNHGMEIDFETRSGCDLRAHGVYVYMEHKTTKGLFASYRINGGAWKRWSAGDGCPEDIRKHIESGGMVSAQNAAFERLLINMVLTKSEGWPHLPPEQTRCTAATAASLSLPRDLGRLTAALDLDVQKDKIGMKLIRLFSIPRAPRDGENPDGVYFNTPEEYPEEWAQFKGYCDTDVISESLADDRMVPLSEDSQRAYALSERINDRGIRIDVRSAQAALKLAEKAKALIDDEIALVTAGYVTAGSQVGRISDWLKQQDFPMKSLGAPEIEDVLECDDVPDEVRSLLELRQEYAKTSVSKLQSFMNRVGSDGRIRGAFLFRAAGTGRYSSVGAQLHNMPRPRKAFGKAKLRMSTLFAALKMEDPQLLKYLYGDDLGRTLWLLSDAIRGFLWAAPGKELIAADYSGIEGAVAAWFAEEKWKVKAIQEILDDPEKPDLYRRAAAGIYNTTPEKLTKEDERRQVGKVSELSLQYQGGVGAFRSMARGYSLKLGPVYAPVWAAASVEMREKAVKRYNDCIKRKEPTTETMTREEWLASELVKVGWRATHPAITEAWHLLNAAVFDAVNTPGRVVPVLKVKYLVRHGFLWCMLPSGRCLAYGAPRISSVEVPWSDKTQAKKDRERAPAVTAMGVDSQTKQWRRQPLYGGLLFENVVQAIALDLLEFGMQKAEDAGYPVIMHVHDEIVTEVPRGTGCVDEFVAAICEKPDWAEGLPLAGDGWRGKRYRK